MDTHETSKPDRCTKCGRCLANEIVELSPAYMWDCPNCGRENFQRSIMTAITAQDRIEMGLEDNQGGCWQSYPNIVVCRHCDSKYTTRHANTEELDEDEEDEQFRSA